MTYICRDFSDMRIKKLLAYETRLLLNIGTHTAVQYASDDRR